MQLELESDNVDEQDTETARPSIATSPVPPETTHAGSTNTGRRSTVSLTPRFSVRVPRSSNATMDRLSLASIQTPGPSTGASSEPVRQSLLRRLLARLRNFFTRNN